MGLFDGTPLERPVTCEQCGQPVTICSCPAASVADVPAEKQRLRVRLEKRKRGKIVTVIAGFSCSASQLRTILKELKDLCGAGGTIDQAQIEIQGDHVDRVRQLLISRGFVLMK